MQRHVLLRSAILRTGLALAPLFVLNACAKAASDDGSHKDPGAVATPPVAVATVAVEERNVPEHLEVTGTLMPDRESRVAAGVAGKVAATYVERGSLIKQGQVLVQLDTRLISANVAEAKAALAVARTQREQAKADCQRSQQLFDKGAATQAEYDRLQTQCRATQEQAEAAEARARALSVTLTDSAIRAPFSGRVVERNVNAGEYVQAATVVATLVQIDPLRLELSVPERAAGKMRTGLAVDFAVSQHEEERFGGKVRYVGPSVRRSSRDLLVEAVVANPSGHLIPGTFVTGRIALGEARHPVVPASAVRHDGSLHYLFVVHDDKVEQRLVQLGETTGEVIAVLDGVRAGDRVAVDPRLLMDGQRIVAQAKPSGAAAGAGGK